MPRIKRPGTMRPDKTVGYGFVGRWNGGLLGWGLPNYVYYCSPSYPGTSSPGDLVEHMATADKPIPTYLCKITVELVRDKLGRPITRVERGGE